MSAVKGGSFARAVAGDFHGTGRKSLRWVIVDPSPSSRAHPPPRWLPTGRRGAAGSDLSAEESGFACCVPDGVALCPGFLFLCTEVWAAVAGQHRRAPGRAVPCSRKGI